MPASTNIGVIVRSRTPDEKLVELVCALDWVPDGRLLIVTDHPDAPGAAQHLATCEDYGAEVLRIHGPHAKGTLFNTGVRRAHALGCASVVIADGDGRHSASDLRRIYDALAEHPDDLVLGVRRESDMSLGATDSRIVRAILHLVYGYELQDPLTELRGVPLTHFAEILALKRLHGDRVVQMIFSAARLFNGITEIELLEPGHARDPIQRRIARFFAVFRALFGSLPKFILSSLSCTGLDLVIYSVLFYGFGFEAWQSAIGARVVSATCNFLINKNFVFKGAARERYDALHFFPLAAGVLSASTLSVFLLVDTLGLPALPTKIVVDLLLFFVNYTVQNAFANK